MTDRPGLEWNQTRTIASLSLYEIDIKAAEQLMPLGCVGVPLTLDILLSWFYWESIFPF